MLAAEKGYREVCLKLAELGADLNKADIVSETCEIVYLLYHYQTHPLI